MPMVMKQLDFDQPRRNIVQDHCKWAKSDLENRENEEGFMLMERKIRNYNACMDLEAGDSLQQQQESNDDHNNYCKTSSEAIKPLLPQHADANNYINPAANTAKINNLEPCKQERLASLDVFRGITVVAMILVDYAGGLWSAINHSPWDGITFADFVVPAFLFIVGVSLALTHKTLDDRKTAACKIILRTLKIFGLGLILQGGYLHGVKDLSYGVDLQFLRIMGVLQRIAIAYVIVAFFEVCSSNRYIADANESFLGILKIYRWQWIAAFVLMSLYAGLLYGIYVPDWHFKAPSYTSPVSTNSSLEDPSLLLVKCNVRGSMSPSCNAVGFLDRLIMGMSHLYRSPTYKRTKECSINYPFTGPLPDNAPSWCLAAFDPEGLLSSIPAVVTCFIGAHYGHVLLHMKGHKRQLWQWTTSGFVMLIVGLLLEIAGMPLNKQLYTLSYMFVTGGAVALAFCATYVLVDFYKWRSSMALFKLVGAHSLMIYALLASGVLPMALQGFYWKSPNNNMIRILLKSLGF